MGIEEFIGNIKNEMEKEAVVKERIEPAIERVDKTLELFTKQLALDLLNLTKARYQVGFALGDKREDVLPEVAYLFKGIEPIVEKIEERIQVEIGKLFFLKELETEN